MSRRDRRANNPAVQERKQQYEASSVFGGPLAGVGGTGGQAKGSGGWGVGNMKQTPASGQSPAVNPFMIPKGAGLNIISQTFPSNYFVEWNLSTWRAACDQAIKMGYPISYATLVSWVFESSPFVQSLFNAIGSAVGKIPFICVDEKGNELPEWTQDLCSKSWQKELRKEIAFSLFWGFTGINIDPVNGKIYKYPMQQLDPISRMLKQSTFSFDDGLPFASTDNLLFIQPSTSYEKFLGWMQPISRSFIQMNLNSNNWVAAGRKLAFPLMTVGYPQTDSALDPESGNQFNPYKLQAEDVVASADPGKGLVYPYTLDDKGNIVKSLEIEFEKTGANAKAHDIFKDFNNQAKDEIREMILGGTLTASVGDSGSRALGEVQQEKFDTVISDIVEFIETYLNDEYRDKIKKFYKDFPDGLLFAANKAKQLTLDDITKLSTVLVQNGKRLTAQFFEANGLVQEFFEDAPAMNVDTSSDEEFAAAIPTRTLFGAKKKV